jgi:hypothetical protein
MRSFSVLLAALGLIGHVSTAPAATLDGLAVDVRNKSEPVLCAEKDNVSIELASPEVRSFRIEANHPAYIGGLREDRFEPDWTACEDISAETSATPPGRKVTFFENVDLWLTGHSFANFWRPNQVTFRVGDTVEKGLDLVQLWVRRKERAEEVLVIYPADGYWRIRPLPPAHLGWSAYGSSFLIGPIDMDGRPVVNIKDIAFDAKTMIFTLSFTDGGRATVKIDTLNPEKMALDVTFDQPVQGKPFVALRSMYVTEFNADVARIAAREEGARSWREEPIMAFDKARATDVWMGRLVPSRHNTSAPDMIFNRFRATPPSTR